jgi:TPR repeat protein
MPHLFVLATVLLMLLTPGWAGFDEGLTAYLRGVYATALRELLPLAQQGNAKAQSFLGFLYSKGHGVPQDDAKALQWYR